MVLLGRRSAEERVATFLIGWRERLAAFSAPSKTIPLPMSRLDIADFLGLTIETVSRTFTKLERDGVIEIAPGCVEFVDAARGEAMTAAQGRDSTVQGFRKHAFDPYQSAHPLLRHSRPHS